MTTTTECAGMQACSKDGAAVNGTRIFDDSNQGQEIISSMMTIQSVFVSVYEERYFNMGEYEVLHHMEMCCI